MIKNEAYYTYLISSLPMLHFGMRPLFSFGKFLEMCKDLVSSADMKIIKKPTLKKWRAFETALRNELVKIRAHRRHIDPMRHLRGDGYADPDIAGLAMNAYKNPSILESEKMLDKARWNALDELAAGHYFDRDFLVIYALKLLILERWEKVETADKERLVGEILERA